MLNRLKTAAKGGGDAETATANAGKDSGRWNRRGSRTADRDQFRVQQQSFYVRGDLILDLYQARGLRAGATGDRNTYCVVLVDREKVGETSVANKTQAPVWNQALRVPHEVVRQAADRNVWPVPCQPLIVQLWDKTTTSDVLMGSARVSMSHKTRGEIDHWHRIVGAGDQGMDGEPCGSIRVRVSWESPAFADSPKDEPRFFLRDVFPPKDKDYEHLYAGGLASNFLVPPAGEEVLAEMMTGVSRYDPTASGYGRGVEGMLVLTELRLLFMPDVNGGLSTASYLDFHTVQVYLAAIRNFTHRGLEGGSRVLSLTTREGRSVHFRMPPTASSCRCGQWYEDECSRRRLSPMNPGAGGAQLWARGLWGAGSSEQWMERLIDEIRWKKAQADFVAIWHHLCQTSIAPRTSSAAHIADPAGVAADTSHQAGRTKGDLADGWGALERDLERVGVSKTDSGSYTTFGRQMWEIKTANRSYAMVPTYPQVLAFPSAATPAQLASAAPQRSRKRLPALVWLHPTSRAPLVRSSQPMSGMTTKVLSEDIHLLKQIRFTLDATKISIVDARSLLNAKANQMTGKGYEDVADIGRDVATLGFMGIDNIHAVRDSLAAFSAASQTSGQEYFHAVGASGWLRHLGQIMKAAAFVVDELQRGVAVLVHCSDGWDRTSQLTALAQLCMDPYYRTLEGFETLVEKEWCSFGHMFGLRAHSDSPTESSPVFLQWLDAVWQLVRQYPAAFEFTGHYLERLVEALYSAAFINFAGNCERERRDKLKELQSSGAGAVSIFSYLRDYATEGHIIAPLLNNLYRPVTGCAKSSKELRQLDILRPCCEAQGLEIWQAVYMRDSLLLHNREHQLPVEQALRLQVAMLTKHHHIMIRRLLLLLLLLGTATAMVSMIGGFSFSNGIAVTTTLAVSVWSIHEFGRGMMNRFLRMGPTPTTKIKRGIGLE